VAVDGTGDLFIADTYNNQVVEVTAGIPVTVYPLTAANLQAVLATTSSVTLDAATDTDAQTVLTTVDSLAAQAPPVTITVDLASGSFTDLTASPPAGVTLVPTGDGDDDILIAGTTDYDANAAALGALIKEWGRTDESYLTRINNRLDGIVSGGQTYALNASTVHTDTAIDVLYGSGGMDWFFVQVSGTNKDQVKDKTSGEVITGL
jgi:hypothetical protein